MSERIVCPATRKNGPVVPLITHSAVNVAKLLDKAQPREQSVRIAVATRYVERRPMIVVTGSHMSAERAMATKTPALAVLIAVGSVPKVAAISGLTVMMEVLMNVTGTAIQHTTKRIIHRRQEESLATLSSE
jgi:hypothetical protein